MGATRPASVIVQQLFCVGAFPFYFPDAGRVAPIRASVSSCTKRYTKRKQQTQSLMGTTRPAENMQ